MSLRCHSYQSALQIQDKNKNSKMINADEELEKWDSDPLLEEQKLHKEHKLHKLHKEQPLS